MKRFFAAIAAFALLLSLAACGKNPERQEAIAVLQGTSTTAYALSTGTELPRQALFQSDQVEIWIAGIQGDPGAPELVLAVKNGTRKDVQLWLNSVTINGWKAYAWDSIIDIESHSVDLVVVECECEAGTELYSDIGTLRLAGEVLEDDAYDELGVFDVTLETTASDSISEAEAPEGITLLDASGVKVIAAGLRREQYGTALRLYVENNTAGELEVECQDAYVNGEPINLWVWETVDAFGRSVISEHLYDDDYEDIYLEPGDELTFYLTAGSASVWLTADVTLTPEDFP